MRPSGNCGAAASSSWARRRLAMWSGGRMARTVPAPAAMRDIMGGLPVGRPHWAPAPARPFAELARERPASLRLRLAVRSTHVDTDSDVAAAIEGVARLLEK